MANKQLWGKTSLNYGQFKNDMLFAYLTSQFPRGVAQLGASPNATGDAWRCPQNSLSLAFSLPHGVNLPHHTTAPQHCATPSFTAQAAHAFGLQAQTARRLKPPADSALKLAEHVLQLGKQVCQRDLQQPVAQLRHHGATLAYLKQVQHAAARARVYVRSACCESMWEWCVGGLRLSGTSQTGLARRCARGGMRGMHCFDM